MTPHRKNGRILCMLASCYDVTPCVLAVLTCRPIPTVIIILPILANLSFVELEISHDIRKVHMPMVEW